MTRQELEDFINCIYREIIDVKHSMRDNNFIIAYDRLNNIGDALREVTKKFN